MNKNIKLKNAIIAIIITNLITVSLVVLLPIPFLVEKDLFQRIYMIL
ncbi:hypothetical protein [Caloramator sp. Dgby_cultured_2]|nr:hypothetical protein [Caloramator sp. Dgby_cultured_2]WDU83543.1 hypothetical protein PWK10_02495 [Caloramator sp. Dgby_cultured_2]